MKKDKLLEFIERALRIEEDAVQILSKHVQTATEWSGYSEKDNTRIHEVLKTISLDSMAHAEILGRLREKIQKGVKDVY